MNFDTFINRSTGFRKIEYNWRDMALYALAVGAHEDDLIYLYEKNMKALPSFGVLPYWNAVNNEPQRPLPYPATSMVWEALGRELGEMPGGLHMDHELIMHRPIDPIQGTLVFEDVITDIYDRGEGKGIVVQSKTPVYDVAGNLLCENISRCVYFTHGGFGGKKPPKTDTVIPDRAPDRVIEDYVGRTQNLLYRLTGDTNYLHIDPEYARSYGFPRPIMQGLCSFGFGCRLAIQAAIPGEPERMTRIAAQMRNVCFPGTRIALCAWREGEGRLVFQLLDQENQRPILDKGVFEYQ